jgi:Spy/CpxP family protein refolding chaperone
MRAIKALSAEEAQAYLDGAGSGFARAAELNGHPGPMHALELADALALTESQRAQLQTLMREHRAEARRLGADVVRLERELDALFAQRQATRDGVERKTAEVGLAQARYRASHLTTHVATAALLTPEQIAHYNQLRGYTSGAPATPRQHRHHAP